jgi:hypothetical protein
MTMILTGFLYEPLASSHRPPKTCGNDEQKQAVKIVIHGSSLPAGRLDPWIQSLFKLNAKEGKYSS